MVKRCHLSVTRPGIASSSLIRQQWPTNVNFVTPRNPISPRKHGLCERLSIVRLSWFCGVSAGINASRNNSPVSFNRANSPVQVDTKRILFANSTHNSSGMLGFHGFGRLSPMQEPDGNSECDRLVDGRYHSLRTQHPTRRSFRPIYPQYKYQTMLIYLESYPPRTDRVLKQTCSQYYH